MKHLFVALLLVVSTFSVAKADEAAAKAFVEKTANGAIEILATDKSDNAKLTSLRSLFTNSVDVEWIGRFVLGRNWRGLNETQKSDYLANYRTFLINHYTSNFEEYSDGTTFKVTDSRPLKKSGEYLVNMQITQTKNPQPIEIDYRVHDAENGMKITDIIVEGVSLLSTQRSEFASVINRKGVDHLISQLKSKS